MSSNLCFKINDILYGININRDIEDLRSENCTEDPTKKFNFMSGANSILVNNKFEIKYILNNVAITPNNMMGFLDFISTIPKDYIDVSVENNICAAIKSMNNTDIWDKLSTKEDVESHKFKIANFIFKDAKNPTGTNDIPNIEDYTGVYPGTDAAAVWKRYWYAKKKGHNVNSPDGSIERVEANIKNLNNRNNIKNTGKTNKISGKALTKHAKDVMFPKNKSKKTFDLSSDDESSTDGSEDKLTDESSDEKQRKKIMQKKKGKSPVERGTPAERSSNERAPAPIPDDVLPAKNYGEFIANETNAQLFKHVSYFDKQQLLFSKDDTLYIFNCLYSKTMNNALRELIALLGTNNNYSDNLVYVVNNMPNEYVASNKDMINHYMYYAFIILNKEVQYTRASINKSSRCMFKLEDVCNLPNFKDVPLHHRCYVPFISDDISEDKLFMYIGSDNRDVSYGMVSPNQFRERFGIYTRNVFNNFDFKKCNMFIVGSSMTATVGLNPLEIKYKTYQDFINAVYYESDIDIAYCGDSDEDFHINAMNVFNHIKITIPEAKLNVIDRKFEIKYEIDMGFKTIDLFKSNVGIGPLVTRFHLNCVRMYYDGVDVFITSEGIGALMTGVNKDNRVFFNNTNPMNLVIKYARKGYTSVLNVRQRHNILKYVNNSEWKNGFKSVLNAPTPVNASATNAPPISFIKSEYRKETIVDFDEDKDTMIKLVHLFGSFSVAHEFFNCDINDCKKPKYSSKDFFTKKESIPLNGPVFVNNNIITEDNINIPVNKRHFKPKWNDKNYVLSTF